VSRKQISEIALLAAVLLSALSLADATSKYVGCYDALANFKMDLIGVYFVSTPEKLNVTIQLKIFNPTSYGDLRLDGIYGVVYYEGENHTILVSAGGPRSATPYQEAVTPWWKLPESQTWIGHPTYIGPIYPYSTTYALMNLTAKGDDAKIFNAYFEKQGALEENMRWQLNFSVSLDTPIYLNSINLQYEFDR